MAYKISVIMPVYNVEKFLPQCLDSIVNQTFGDFELICINDGSTDGSLQILRDYAKKDERIHIISQINKGLSAARNAGLNFATGEYITFVDSDDWADLNLFEKLCDAAKKYDADIVCGEILRKYPSGKTRDKLRLKEEKLYTTVNEKFAVFEIPRKCYAFSRLYRRSKIQEFNLYFKEGVFFEDAGFVFRAFYYLEKAVSVPGTFYYYRVNPKSITKQMTDKKQQDLLAARKDFLKFAKKHYIVSCGEKWYIKRKVIYKFLGIPLMKIYEWETIKKYYLFALFKIFEKRVSL